MEGQKCGWPFFLLVSGGDKDEIEVCNQRGSCLGNELWTGIISRILPECSKRTKRGFFSCECSSRLEQLQSGREIIKTEPLCDNNNNKFNTYRREDNPKRLIKWGQPTAPETKGIVCIPPPSPRIVIVDEASRIYLASSGVIL